jgi:pentatricopeptide repeat protein
MHTWKGLSVKEREHIWPQVMIAALYQGPDTAYMVCAATLDPPPPGHAIADVLLLAAKHYQIPERRTRARTNELYDFVLQLLTKLPPGYIPFEQSTFGILVDMLTRDQAAALHGALEESQVMLHPDTSLHFAYKLVNGPAHFQHREKAFRIMEGLANDGVDLNGPRCASVITALLHCEAPNEFSPKDGDDFSPTHVLEALMEKGFIPNVITFTAYLDSLVQRGEAEEAVRLAKFYSDSGVALDAKAFVTVFRGAKQSMDPTLLRDVLQLAQKTNNLSVEILNNALHAIFCAAEDDVRQDDLRPSEALRPFIPMLRIYAKMFNLQPLQSLIPDALPFMLMSQSNPEQEWKFEQTIVPVVDEFASSLGGRFVDPDSTTLATMFRAYIRSLSRPYDLMSLYSYFKSQLENQKMEGNYATQLVREHGSLIHDTFMVAMLPQPGFTRPALEVFGDMLRTRMSASTTTEGDKSAEAKPSGNVHPEPTIYTFGILLHGLLRMEQTELAEQIKRIMEEAGVEPNLAIWNILLRGYAKMQNVPQTVSTLRKLEASGFRPDKHTFKAFGLLRNQRAALEMMEEVIDINQRELNGQLSERGAWRLEDEE